MLITVRDASKKIGITSKQLYRLIERGEARPLKIGERYYFDDYSLLMSRAKMQGVITDDLADLIQPNRKN